ncbi:MAG: hypothetical protein ABIS84_07050 [Arachnia sp.]
MKVTTSVSILNEFCLTATPDDYDGAPPLPTFTMDHWPTPIHDDRLALASFLLFRPWISGVLAIDGTVSPALSQMVRSVHTPVWVHLEPVELRPKALASGSRSLTISMVGAASAPIPVATSRTGDVSVSVLRSDQATGAIRTATGLDVASNAFMFADTPARRDEVLAAVACLLGQELGVGEVSLPGAATPLARLMRAVGMAVQS